MPPHSSYSDLTSLTIESWSPTIADNFSISTALLFRLREKGKIKYWTGGDQITQTLAYQENQTVTRFSGYDTVDVSPSDVFTKARFAPKQASVAVSFSVLEELQNDGKEAMFDLIEERVDVAQQSLIQTIGDDMYSDGTANGSKQIGGLSHLLASAATNTVGGIDKASWSFWQHLIVDASTGIGGGAVVTSSSTIQSLMTYAMLNTTRNQQSVDLIMMGNTFYSYYLASLQANQRFTNAKLAEGGFENVRFMSADCAFEGVGSSLSASVAYGLNTNTIHFRPHKKAYFVPADPDRHSVNQLATVKLIHFAGNMTASNMKLNFRIQE